MSGGGGSSGGGSSTTTTVQSLSPQQAELFNLTSPIFKSYIDKSGPTVAPWQGQTMAPFNDLQSVGQQMVLSNAVGPVNDAVTSVMKGTDFLTSGAVLKPESNPGLSGALDAATRRITDNFSQQIMPQIRDEAVLAGGYGGSGQGIASGLAAKAATQTVADTSASMINDNYKAGLDAMVKGLAFAPQSIAQGSVPGATVGAVGDVRQAQQQAGINDMISNYYTKTFFPLTLAEEIAGIAMGMPGGSTSSFAKQGSGGSNSGVNISGAATGALGGAAAGSSFGPWGTAGGALLGGLAGLFG
jgi:hypothetical protein